MEYTQVFLYMPHPQRSMPVIRWSFNQPTFSRSFFDYDYADEQAPQNETVFFRWEQR